MHPAALQRCKAWRFIVIVDVVIAAAAFVHLFSHMKYRFRLATQIQNQQLFVHPLPRAPRVFPWGNKYEVLLVEINIILVL